MKLMHAAALSAALLVAACAPNPVKVIQPVSTTIQNASMVDDVQVRLSPLAGELMRKFEEKAQEKRRDAGLPPVDASVEASSAPRDEYATLPFAQMFELLVKDVAREHGLTSGRPLRLDVEIDTLKTANAAMAILAASNDQLAGTVTVRDAQSGDRLGEFYVDVINSHGGLLGLAIRGSGVREKLSEEFAQHIARQLTGKKKKK